MVMAILTGLLLILILLVLSDISLTLSCVNNKISWSVSGLYGLYVSGSDGTKLFFIKLDKTDKKESSEDEDAEKKAKDKDSQESKKEKKDNKKDDGIGFFALLNLYPLGKSVISGILRALWALIFSLFMAIRFSLRDVRLVFGLYDPAETGMLSALLYSLNIGRIEPVWTKPCLDATFTLSVRLRILWIFLYIARFFLTLPYFSFVKLYFAYRKNKRNNKTKGGEDEQSNR
jgi:hypothetical protein